MMFRCYNNKCHNYNNYGGRGISVCDRWHDINNFIYDMKQSFVDGLELDRIDNDGNYEPSNCRWVTRSEQNFNRRISAKNISGFRGVLWCKPNKKWRAQITSNKKYYHIGYFENAKQAAIAFDNFIVENNLPNKKNFN